jgi:energy-coupling factor transporter transmembrane protein EcfT
MKDIIATIYEKIFGLYNADFTLIFDHLYDNGGYVYIGWSLCLISLICSLLFYYVWKYPYAKKWHWLLWLILTMIIIFGVTYGITNLEIFASNNQALNDAIADVDTGYNDYATSLPWQYALYNGFLAGLLGFIYSLAMKQFSKIQIHLPF